MASKTQLQSQFQSAKHKRIDLNLHYTKTLSQLLEFIESSIRREFQFNFFSFTICGGQRRLKIDPYFQKAFLNLSLEQRISYYETAIDALYERTKQTSIQMLKGQESDRQCISIKVIKGFKNSSYVIKMPAYVLDCGHYELGLNAFLLRKSKKHQNNFIYEHMKNQQPTSIRFQIVEYSQRKEDLLIGLNSNSFKKYILGLNEGKNQQRPVQIRLKKQENSPSYKEYSEINLNSKTNLSPEKNNKYSLLQINTSALNHNDVSVVETLIQKEETNAEQIYNMIERAEENTQVRKHTRYSKNICQIMLPHFSLAHLDNLADFLPLHRNQNKKLYIYYHAKQKEIYRLQMYLNERADTVVKQLCEIQNYKLWNHSINQSHIKLSITSDNANLVYFKQKSHSQWFRERDFLFLRHLFKIKDQYYIIDRSVQNSHFVPFQSILRGVIHYCVTKIQSTQPDKCKLILQINADYGGLLLFQAKQQLILTYLKEYQNLQNFIHRFKKQLKNSFDLQWQIQPTAQQSQQNMLKQDQFYNSNIFDNKIQKIDVQSANSDEFYSIDDAEENKIVYEISQNQLRQKRQLIQIKELNKQQIQLNQDGLINLPKKYLNTKHPLVPFPKAQPKRDPSTYENIMLKNDFQRVPTGGMKLVNPQKLAALENVLRFIMSSIRSNIMSGTNPFSLSLPVQIFHVQSNLHRLCHSMSHAPDYLEAAVNKNALERMKHCAIFAFTNSTLYFDIDKVFNPILGETYQGYIDGCPIYGQQISHHPPISSALLIGRGYKVHASLESKVYMHLNSGDGVNQGFYNIEFQDGGRVVFQTCPGQLSGLTYGDRQFSFIGKTFIIDSKNKLFCILNFEDESGFFSKNKWKYKDQIEGQIYKVTQGFIRKFFQTKTQKKAISPTGKDIEQTLAKITGRWLQQICIDGVEWYNLKSKPFQLIDYEFPLNSNSNYREDLFYRKKNNLARSQKQKQRLQVLQRHDRKMRQKYAGKKH